MDRRAWRVTVHGMAKSWKQLSMYMELPPGLRQRIEDISDNSQDQRQTVCNNLLRGLAKPRLF